MLIYFCTIKNIYFEILYEVINYVDLFCTIKNINYVDLFCTIKIMNYVDLFLNTLKS